MSQRRSQISKISVSNEAVNTCVRYILYREGSKIPIKHTDIRDHLKATCDTPGNEISAVVAAATKVLKNVYGYDLVKDDSKGNQYIVILEKPCKSLKGPLIATEEQVLLNAGLAHILMSGGSVKEDDMWKFLTKAQLLNEHNSSKVRQIFTKKFHQQSYIITAKRTEGEQTKIQFEWGPRASKEVSKMYMLEKVAEALGKMPDFWTEQFNIANKEEQIRTVQNVQLTNQ